MYFQSFSPPKEEKKIKEEEKEIINPSNQGVTSPTLNLNSMLSSALSGDGRSPFPFTLPDGANIASLLSGIPSPSLTTVTLSSSQEPFLVYLNQWFLLLLNHLPLLLEGEPIEHDSLIIN